MKARLIKKRSTPARSGAARLRERVRELHECNTQKRTPPSARFPGSEKQVHRPNGGPELEVWLATQAQRYREGYAFREMGLKLRREALELKRERYVTAMLGVETSWPRILDAAKYVLCSEVELA